MRVEEALIDVSRLYLDTAPVIYLVERNPQFFDVIRAIFQKVNQGQLTVVASPITLAECLVGAYRLNQALIAARFTQYLTQGGTEFVQISAAIGDLAAQIRVQYNLKLVDALQIATALDAQCQGLRLNLFFQESKVPDGNRQNEFDLLPQ